jgi:hypothetical protein
MKKNFAFFVAFCLISVLSQAQIVITEISYNPPEAGTDSLEYVELLNNSSNQVDVSGWSFSQGFEYVFPAGVVLSPGEYVVISKTYQYFFDIFGFYPLVWVAGGALTNGGEDIVIKNTAGITIDSVDYKNVAPWPTSTNGQGPSLVLCDPNADNNVATNWSAATTATGKIVNNIEIFANPGAAAGCSSVIVALDDIASVVSGDSIIIPITANDIKPNPVASVVIITPATNGTATINTFGDMKYKSTAGYCGTDLVKYRICDSSGACDTANVTINVICFPLRTIAQMTTENANGVADSIGRTCIVEGQVNIKNLRTAGLQFSMQDAGAGITVFRAGSDFGYIPAVGQRVRVRGTIQQFNGLTQIIPDTVVVVAPPFSIVSASVPTHNESNESEFIMINTPLQLVNPAQWTTGVGTGFTVAAVKLNAPTDTISIRIDNDITDLFTAAPPSTPFTVQGACSQFDTTDPFTSGYQIIPRQASDIVPIVKVSEPLDVQVNLSPNPVSDLVRITLDKVVEKVFVTDLSGRLMANFYEPQLQMEMSTTGWATGVYLVTFQKENKSHTVRLVKQ